MKSRFYYDGHHQAVATGIRDHLNSVSDLRSVADVLAYHTTLELERVDRMYLNLYVLLLQTPMGVAHYLHEVYGYQVPSSVLLAPGRATS